MLLVHMSDQTFHPVKPAAAHRTAQSVRSHMCNYVLYASEELPTASLWTPQLQVFAFGLGPGLWSVWGEVPFALSEFGLWPQLFTVRLLKAAFALYRNSRLLPTSPSLRAFGGHNPAKLSASS